MRYREYLPENLTAKHGPPGGTKLKNNTLKLVYGAMFITLIIIATRFLSITLPTLRIGLGIIPIAVCGIFFGPVYTGTVAALADFIGVTLWPSGPFFPGFTLSAFVTGYLLSLFLKGKGYSLRNVVIAVALVTIIVHMGMNTLWLSMIRGVPFMVLFPVRFLNQVILSVVYVLVIAMTQKYIIPRIRLKI